MFRARGQPQSAISEDDFYFDPAAHGIGQIGEVARIARNVHDSGINFIECPSLPWLGVGRECACTESDDRDLSTLRTVGVKCGEQVSNRSRVMIISQRLALSVRIETLP